MEGAASMGHHLRTRRPLGGIVITALGGGVALVGLVSGIVALTGSRHHDIVVRPITLAPSAESRDAGRIVLTEPEGLSLWLRVANRRIEHPHATLSVALVDWAGNTVARMHGDFRNGPSRSDEQGYHYYRLGTLDSGKPLAGHLRYQVTGRVAGGASMPPRGPALVIRRLRPFPTPLPEATLLLAGFGLIGVGIRRQRLGHRRRGQ